MLQSVRLWGRLLCTALFRSPRMFSVTFRAWFWQGHSKNVLEFWWSHYSQLICGCMFGFIAVLNNRCPLHLHSNASSQNKRVFTFVRLSVHLDWNSRSIWRKAAPHHDVAPTVLHSGGWCSFGVSLFCSCTKRTFLKLWLKVELWIHQIWTHFWRLHFFVTIIAPNLYVFFSPAPIFTVNSLWTV